VAIASGRIDVAAEATDTWAAATDWAAQHHWVLGSRVRAGLGDGRGVGGTIIAETGYGPLTITDPMEITQWDPPRSVTLRHTGRLVSGTATYQVESLGPSRSRLTWSEELTAPHPALQPIYALGVPMFTALIRVSLRRFARWAPLRH
jgi:hypothetical protein